MTGISRTLLLTMPLIVATTLVTITSGASAKASVDIQDFAVSRVSVGMPLQTVMKVLKGSPERRDLSNTSYEMNWPGAAAVVFKAPSNTVTEINGTVLDFRNQRVGSKGMSSEQFFPKVKALGWGEPVVVGPENHSWTQSPIEKMAYCNLHYNFASGSLSFLFTNDRIKSITLASANR